MKKLSERMHIMLALLQVCGPQPTSHILQVVSGGQTVFLAKQRDAYVGQLRRLEEMGLAKSRQGYETVWVITEKGRRVSEGKEELN